jgi:hypothetical protein
MGKWPEVCRTLSRKSCDVTVVAYGALLAHPATFMQGLRASLLIAAGVALATAASLSLRKAQHVTPARAS